MSNSFIEGLRKSYSSKSLAFLEKYHEMEGAKYEYINEDKLANDYREIHHKLNNELMWHRNTPVPEERLNKLRDLKHFLPRHINIVLDSL